MRRFMPLFVRLLTVTVTALLAIATPALAQAPSPDIAASAPPNTGELVVLNDSGRTLIPSNQVVTDNGRPLVSLPRQTFARLFVTVGAHQLRPDPFLWKQEVNLDVTTGSRHYVVVAYKPERSWAKPFGGTPLILREISEADALPLMREMKPQ